eukprot:862246-Alexandrium_andersonii.AAC.1
MSASLVGSEMCIRDSAEGALHLARTCSGFLGLLAYIVLFGGQVSAEAGACLLYTSDAADDM